MTTSHHPNHEDRAVLVSSASQNDLPVAIAGAGPVGLAAAAHLAGRGVASHHPGEPLTVTGTAATAAGGCSR